MIVSVSKLRTPVASRRLLLTSLMGLPFSVKVTGVYDASPASMRVPSMKQPNVMSEGASETCVLPVSCRRTKSFRLRLSFVTKFFDKALFFCPAKEFVLES